MSRVALILLPLFVAQAGGCQDPDRFAAWLERRFIDTSVLRATRAAAEASRRAQT